MLELIVNDVLYTMIAETAQQGAFSMTLSTCSVPMAALFDNIETGSKKTFAAVRHYCSL